MNSNYVTVDKDLVTFALNRIIKYEMLNRQLGTFSEVLDCFEFSEEDFNKINIDIKNGEFPEGYYSLCEILGDVS